MAVTKPLRLTVNYATRKLVAYLGTPTAIPELFQGNQLALEIQFVDESGIISAPYTILDLAGYGLRVSVGSQPTGTAGGPAALALQTAFTWDTTRKLFTGTLATNTAGIDSHIGAADSKISWFEVNITDGTDRLTALQTTFTLRAVVDEGSSTVPTPTDQYPTKAEADGLYLSRAGNTAMYLTNQTTGKTMVLYLGADDTLHTEIVS